MITITDEKYQKHQIQPTVYMAIKIIVVTTIIMTKVITLMKMATKTVIRIIIIIIIIVKNIIMVTKAITFTVIETKIVIKLKE